MQSLKNIFPWRCSSKDYKALEIPWCKGSFMKLKFTSIRVSRPTSQVESQPRLPQFTLKQLDASG